MWIEKGIHKTTYKTVMRKITCTELQKTIEHMAVTKSCVVFIKQMKYHVSGFLLSFYHQ